MLCALRWGHLPQGQMVAAARPAPSVLTLNGSGRKGSDGRVLMGQTQAQGPTAARERLGVGSALPCHPTLS